MFLEVRNEIRALNIINWRSSLLEITFAIILAELLISLLIITVVSSWPAHLMRWTQSLWNCTNLTKKNRDFSALVCLYVSRYTAFAVFTAMLLVAAAESVVLLDLTPSIIKHAGSLELLEQSSVWNFYGGVLSFAMRRLFLIFVGNKSLQMPFHSSGG
jgi:hypothetical protein